ncbi:MAG: hypothetical protein IJS44_05730 [Clostridia bacterium]|nr:hypothetical protein [Clostridia bacterium]
MTAQRLFSDKWLDSRLLCNLLRRRTVHILVAFLAVFFSLAVPLMLFGDLGFEIGMQEKIERFVERLSEIFGFYTVATGALGVYFGGLTMHYMMDKRSAVFYHALPQKRHTLLLASILSALLAKISGVLIGLCVAICVIAAQGMLLDAVWLTLGIHLLNNAIFFLTIYAVTVFMGSFSGNTTVQVLLSLVSFGYLPIMILMIFAAHEINAAHFDMEYYISAEFMNWTTPVTWPFLPHTEVFPLWRGIVWVCVAVLLIVLTFFIYRRRKIENTGKTVLFARVGSLIKYLLMAAAALVGDLFFTLFNGGFSIFGLACGIFLSFIICNTILEKTPKGMFKGVKGLIVFSLAAAVFFAVWQADIFHIDEYLPRAEQLSYAEVIVDDTSADHVRFDDAQTISALLRLLGAAENTDGASPYPGVYVKAVLHQKFGPPLARRYYLPYTADGMRDFLPAYADAADLLAPYRKFDERIRTLEHPYADLEIYFDGGYNYVGNDLPIADLMKVYLREIGDLDGTRISAPAVMYFSVRSVYTRAKSDGATEYYNMYEFGDYRYYIRRQLPVYADMTATIEFLTEYIKNDPGAKPSRGGTPASAVVYRTEGASGDYPQVTLSAAQTAALLPYLCDLDATPYSLRAFVDLDTEYYVIVYFSETDTEYSDGEDAEIFGDTPTPQTFSNESYTFFFPRGSVPASVRQLFK